MILATFIMGPHHGLMLKVESPLRSSWELASVSAPKFERYEFGEPYSTSTNIHREMHIYVLMDTVEDGVEEVALYIHSEACGCDKSYMDSEWVQQQMPANKDSLPKYNSMPRIGRPRKGDIY